MDSAHGDEHSSHESGRETPAMQKDANPDLNLPTTSRPMGEMAAEVTDLRRENFDLKLRIFFLEQNQWQDVNTSSASRTEYQHHHHHQIGPNPTAASQAISSSRHSTSDRTVAENDIHQLKSALEQCRQENAELRRLLNNSEDSSKNRSVIPATSSITNATNTSIVQFETHERELRNEIELLKEKLYRAQQEYEEDLKKYEDRRIKAENALRSLKKTYDDRLSRIESHRSRSSSNYDTYQHEPLRARIRFFYPMQGQVNSDANVDKYLQQISEQDQHIAQLTHELEELRSKKPSSNSAINGQIAYDQDKLRAECDALRHTEQRLRQEIGDLASALGITIQSSDSLIPANTTSTVITDQRNPDSKIVVDETTKQLRHDTDNITGIASHVKQLVKIDTEHQRLLKEKDAKIREYEEREANMSSSVVTRYQIKIRELEEEKQNLNIQYRDSEHRVRELTDEISQLRPIESQYRSEMQKLKQQIDDLQEQYRASEKRVREYQGEVNAERQKYNDLLKRYRELERTKTPTDTRELEEIIERKKQEIKINLTKIEQLKIDLEREQQHCATRLADAQEQSRRDREGDLRRINELQQQYSRLETQLREQERTFHTKQQDYEREINKLEQQRESSVHALQQEQDRLSKQSNTYKARLQNYENSEKQVQAELDTLRNENHTLKIELQRHSNHFENFKREVERAELDRQKAEERWRRTDEENRELSIQNTNLQHDVETLNVRINIELPEYYENQYRERHRDLNIVHEQNIHSIARERDIAEANYQRANSDAIHFEKQYQKVDNELQDVKRVVEKYKQEIYDLETTLRKSDDNFQREKRRVGELEDELARRPPIPGNADSSKLQPSSLNYVDLVAKLQERLQKQDEYIQLLKAQRNIDSEQPDYVQLELRIHINRLEQELQTFDHLGPEYSVIGETGRPQISRNENDIDRRLSRIQAEHEERNKLFDSMMEKHNLTIDEYKQHIRSLKADVQDRHDRLQRLTRDFELANSTIDRQAHDLDQYGHEITRLNVDIQTLLTEREKLFHDIAHLQDRLEIAQQPASSRVQINLYEQEIGSMRNKIEQYELASQNHEREYRVLKEELEEACGDRAELETKNAELQRHCDQMKKQLTSDIVNLEQKLSRQREDLDRSEQERLMLQERLNAFHNDPSTGGDRSSQVQLLIEIKQKDQEIEQLKKELHSDRRDSFVSEGATGTAGRESKFRPRPDLDYLNREDLLYELQKATELNQELNRQLNEKFPSLTELHKQLVQVRHELERQLYVNQVLWRKLNALIDIHGSTTRLELIEELANYQGELAKLRTKSPPTSNRQSAIVHVNDPLPQPSRRDDDIQKLIIELNIRDQTIQQLNEELKKSVRKDENSTFERDNSAELQSLRQQNNALKADISKFRQFEEQNRRLLDENEALRNELKRCKSTVEHYTSRTDALEKRLSENTTSTGETVIRTSDLSQLIDEIRHLRRELERNIIKQNELQAKLDENIRQSRSPRSFKFSGHGISYPDHQVIDASGLIGTENAVSSSSTIVDEQRSRIVPSSVTDLENIEITHQFERAIRPYVVGEIKIHNELRRTMEDIKFDVKATASELHNSQGTTSRQPLEERLNSFDERLIHALDLIETYRQTHLPEKDERSENPFIDQRLIEENKNLFLQQRKYLQIIQHLKEKYKQHSEYIDQLLAQITKMNRKRTDSGEYMAFLLQPTLDVLQKARSNIENHLKETNRNSMPPGSAQSHRHRRRPNNQN